MATIILIGENAFSRFLTRGKRMQSETKNRQVNTFLYFLFIIFQFLKDYKPMVTTNNNKINPSLREKVLEKRIELLNKRILQLEKQLSSSPPKLLQRKSTNKTKSSFLVLPVTYSPVEKQSSTLEIVSSSPRNDSSNQLLLVEQANLRVYETIV